MYSVTVIGSPSSSDAPEYDTVNPDVEAPDALAFSIVGALFAVSNVLVVEFSPPFLSSTFTV